MKKKLLATSLFLVSTFAFAGNANHCIQTKEEWSKVCGPESFKAILKNTCGHDVKVRACVERKAGEGKPSCGLAILGPGKVNNGFYVCKGTGRYTIDASSN